MAQQGDVEGVTEMRQSPPGVPIRRKWTKNEMRDGGTIIFPIRVPIIYELRTSFAAMGRWYDSRLQGYRTILTLNSSCRFIRTMSDFHKLKAEGPSGVYDFDSLKGKVVLIVNTATGCGFATNYKGLQRLHENYKDKGLVVLGFPSAQFNQEPVEDDKMSSFCELNHGVTFPLMKKSDINGDNTNEVFSHLKSKKPGLLGLTRIKWNFEKFLVDKEGTVVKRYASTTGPDSIEKDIKELLK